MTRKTAVFAAVASLALAQAASAQQITKPLSSLAAGKLNGKILCRDGNHVPMTADADQSLPLQIVAQLKCGQEVALLSGTQGYTVSVLTADGKNGYVAWMNVAGTDAASSNKIIRQAAEVSNGTASWLPGAPGSEKLISDGQVVESLTANDVTVQVSLQDTGWKLVAHVAIANDSSETVSVTPSRLGLNDLRLANKLLAQEDSGKMSAAYSHQILWTRSNAVASEKAYLAAPERQPYEPPTANRANHLAEHQSEVLAIKEDFNPHAKTDSLALAPTVLAPNQQAAGAAWFHRDGKRHELILHVPVGGIDYQFPFAFNADN
jgi:hypothetical protein